LAKEWKGRDVITMREFDRRDIDEVHRRADGFYEAAKQKKQLDSLRGKVMASLFFEPSTRTQMSFDTAMERLGGERIGFNDPQRSSVFKGETIADTMKMMEGYADVAVIRHPNEGAAAIAAEASDIPVISGGDGTNQHPTQALLDTYTIRRLKKGLDGLTVLVLGDLRYGRTIKSLAMALSNYDVKLQLYSPPQLKLAPFVVEEVRQKIKVQELDSMDFSHADVIYATRIQKERFPDEEEARKYAYVIDAEKMREAKRDAILLHPLPRVSEIAAEVDADPRAAYFEQAFNGVPVRMALLALVLGK
jgi:aspartate carbamoyltransferase catalytic subunit